MFNRFFCFLLIVILGLNLVSIIQKIAISAVDLQKPYISEVWHGNSNYSDKCTSLEIQSKTAVGYCPMDTWIEIQNPTANSISLNGYSLDVTSNRGFVEQGKCEELDLTLLKGKRTDMLYCEPTKINDKLGLNQTIAPNSQVLFQQKYGTIINMLSRAGFSAQKLDLVRRGASTEFYSASLVDNTGLVIDTFSSSFGANASIQICLDENGNKKQSSSNKPFKAGEKTFYGTPGSKNDCPEIKKVEAPIVPITPLETSKPKKQLEPDTKPIEPVSKKTETNDLAPNPVSQVAKADVDEKVKPQPVNQTNTIQPAQVTALPTPKIEIKGDVKTETKKIVPVTFKVEQETVPVENKVEKPLALVVPANVEVKKEIIQEIKQKPILVETQKIVKPLIAIEKIASKPIQTFMANANPSVVNQTKTIKVVDEKQTKIFGIDVTKAATVDMHTIKVNFIYFDLALILFLLTKTTLENKQHAIRLFDLARRKVWESK